MSQQPYMPLFVDAFIADTTHLSTEELGAYMLLLMAMWRRNGCIPDDDRDLARITRTGRHWKRVKERLRPMLMFDDGEITQKRLQKEMAYVKLVSTKQSNNAKARWNKNKDLPDATAMPTPCPQTHTQTQLVPNGTNQEARTARERGSCIPAGWVPNDEILSWALDEGIPYEVVRREAETMRDWAIANKNRAIARKSDWNLTFKNWLKKNSRGGTGPPAKERHFRNAVAEHLQEVDSANIVELRTSRRALCGPDSERGSGELHAAAPGHENHAAPVNDPLRRKAKNGFDADDSP